MVDLMRLVEQRHLQELDKTLPHFDVGDTVDVHVKIVEGGKSRIQIFSGMVIAIKGAGLRRSFTVRRIVQGEGVERSFPFNSPAVANVEVKRYGDPGRAKLYYLRDRTGAKATRVKERLKPRRIAREKLEAAALAAKKDEPPPAPAAEGDEAKKKRRGRKKGKKA